MTFAEEFLSAEIRRRISITRFESIESTNSEVKARARLGAGEGVLMIADEQTVGRGRLGKSFFSYKNSGLYMSLLLRPKLLPADAVYITTAASLAVNRAIERVFGIITGIKWVNDLLLEGKKICGILTESETGADGEMTFAVLGIGINLCDPPGGYDPEIADRVRSLGVSFSQREKLAAAILEEFFPIYDLLPDISFMQEYNTKRIM